MNMFDSEQSMINQEKRRSLPIFIMLVLSMILPMLGGFILQQFDLKITSIPVHSLVETAGAIMALSLFVMVFSLNHSARVYTHFHWACIALLGMALLDIFHAMMMPGKIFVWLHSLAVLFGGVLFATVWLPEGKVSKSRFYLLPAAVAVIAILISVGSILRPEWVPVMLESGEFSSLAVWINLIGGLGFYIAAINFLERYWRTGNIDELLFTGHTFLFGSSGILFATSALWDLSWWLWHFLRLAAYFIAFYYSFVIFLRENRMLMSTQNELNQSQEAAESANQVANECLERIGQEFRAPMNSIIGTSHLVMKTGLDGKQRSYLENVHQSAELLLGKLNDIQDFIKLELGRLELEVIDFRLGDIIENVGNFIELKSRNKRLSLNNDFDSSLPTALVGDPFRLGQILLNLGRNAVNFSTEAGEITLGGELLDSIDDRVTLHFWVRDTGNEKTVAELEALFADGYQVDSQETPEVRDNALRLVICKKLTDLMGGKVWVEKDADTGSTFHFTVVMERHTQHYIARQTDGDEIRDDISEALGKLRGSKVLLVEDNDINREMSLDLLTSAGITVEMVNNGQEALALLEHEVFDCVLMDVVMPVMDGYTATHKIRQQLHLRDLPIIAMTGNVEEKDRQKVIDCGMNDFITKPVNVNRMFLVMAKWIKREDSRS